ncbi:MAG: sigma-70 family RNA polymerase sigma factor [Rudaea sp.]
MSLDPALRKRLHELLAEYGVKVRRLIETHGLGQHGIDPADIEQEVRIRLWKALERDRNAAFHTSYIQRVVLTTVIDAIRAAKSRYAEPLPDEAEPGDVALIDHRAGPERSARAGQDFSRIKACLSELPQRRREAVVLHLQGFSLREIGQFSGTSEEAARKLLDRGMATLRERLAAFGFGEFRDE